MVLTGGPYEFIYNGNDTGVSGPGRNYVDPAAGPGLTTVSGPATADAGDYANVTWTVQNAGSGDADGAWDDNLELQQVGGTEDLHAGIVPVLLSVAGRANSHGPVHVQLPANVQGVFQYVVTTNATSALFENGATADNTLASSSTLTLALPANPDLQVQSVSAPVHGPGRRHRLALLHRHQSRHRAGQRAVDR